MPSPYKSLSICKSYTVHTPFKHYNIKCWNKNHPIQMLVPINWWWESIGIWCNFVARLLIYFFYTVCICMALVGLWQWIIPFQLGYVVDCGESFFLLIANIVFGYFASIIYFIGWMNLIGMSELYFTYRNWGSGLLAGTLGWSEIKETRYDSCNMYWD